MFRRFKFEDEVHQTLSCVPMAVRRKLDRIGVKLSLDQWQHLSRNERLAICHLPVEFGEERDATRSFIEEVVLSRSNSPTKELPQEIRRSAEPPSVPPTSLTELAHTNGVSLGQSEWDRLDSDERYALIKLSSGPTPSHNLPAALHEFLA